MPTPPSTIQERISGAGAARVITTGAALRAAVTDARRRGQKIGVVPTMGALHAGHLSLVEFSCRDCEFTVVTIFVNPTQFGPQEDFQRYPRALDADLAQLASLPVAVVFAPPIVEIYPPEHATFVEVGRVAEPLEGERRPGHFRGVATVVLKLLNLVTPDVAYFGQKDFQQTRVVRRMVEDLHLPVQVRICPIVREPDGLAMSSRNVYLTAVQRQQALVLSRSLRRACELVEAGERNAEAILGRMREKFAAEPEVRLDYVAIVDPETLGDVKTIEQPAVAVVAAFVGPTRLIDNTWLPAVGAAP